MATGFVSRWKGAILGTARSLIQFGKGFSSFGLSGMLSNQQSVTGVGNGADATEDTLYTYSLPANSLDQNGRQIEITSFGAMATNGNNKTIKLYFGSALVSSGTLTDSNKKWWARLRVIRTAAGHQIISGQMIHDTTWITMAVVPGAEDETAAITIKITGQSGSSAANDVVANGLQVQAFN